MTEIKYKHPEGSQTYSLVGQKSTTDAKGRPLHWIILHADGAKFDRNITMEEFKKYQKVDR